MNLLFFFKNKLKEIYIDNFNLIIYNLIILLIVLLLITIFEIVLLGYKKSSFYSLICNSSVSSRSDLFYYLLNLFNLIVLISPLLGLFVPYIMGKGLRHLFNFQLGHKYLDELSHFFCFMILLDFFNYWQHRFMHKFDFLWTVHSVHHSASEMNIVTVYREHPLDHSLNAIFTAIPIGLMGYPSVDYPYIYIILVVIGHLKHSRLPYKFGFLGKYIFQAPYYHHLHHSIDPRCYNSNYANNLIIWDHIFGTFYDPMTNDRKVKIGLENYNKNPIKFSKQFLLTIKYFYLGILKRLIVFIRKIS
jgi:sterol desaturase/sphingolipid hydroxylase (fatty acid hydroxylase superfamily)